MDNFDRSKFFSNIRVESETYVVQVLLICGKVKKKRVEMRQALGPIGNVAVMQHHQKLDEILIYFYPHFIEELSKVVFKKTVSCNTPAKLDTIYVCTAYACYKRARNARISYSIRLL